VPYGTEKSGSEEVADHKKTAPASAVSSDRDVSFRAAIRGKDLWLVMGIRAVIALTIYTVSTHLVNYAKDGGMSPTNAALLMTIIGAVSILGKIGAGHLADRIGSKRIVITCAATMVVLMLWLSTMISGWMLPLFAVIYGLAYGGSFSTINTIVAEVFGVTEIARILGFVNVGTAVGSLVGPWLAGYLFDTTGGYSLAFQVAAVASMAAVIFTILLGKQGKKSIAVGAQE
jgi:MFS family permease